MKKRKRIIAVLCLLTCLVSYIGLQNQVTGTWKVKAKSSSEVGKSNISIKQRTATTATIKIHKAANAQGYQIFRANTKDGQYTRIASTTNLEFKDKNLKAKNKYYYKIRAYRNLNGSMVYGAYSNIASISATLAKPEKVNVANTTTNRKITWSSVEKASKYNVYRANSKEGTYTYIGNSSLNSFTDKTANMNKEQYYRVRAYKKYSSVKYYGIYSSKVKGLVNQFGNGNNSNINKPQDKPSEDNSSSDTSSNEAFSKEVLRLVNIERANAGLSAVTSTSTLEKAAYIRAQEIKQTFSHTRPDGTSCFTVLKEQNISYQACGENIAYGQRTPEDVMNAWMNSPGHKANILSKNFGKLGVGCYIVNNTVYWTQLFTN